ncbi:MAG: putative molybdenum carrier protein [Chlorobium sp.]|uniref:putative molybdenum carrier protein n=1 Tax=Chlorobium sp. TaxID=1095 RepID=UPI0025C1384F|nr:putative molybdenum carrier protein [Chlorobium sp.]MCF8292156.1 putative molybdenum carrier protein [Chlorobium sp.]MCF8382975.1 putative molybdenum carrier protein [Chlorobium sp.]
MPITIISGGQTGVDRAALDAAIAAGLPHGGWCPKGRLAEDGSIPFSYQLRETSSRAYRTRTSRNVRDSDGTLVILRDRLQGGTRYTVRYAEKIGRPLLIVRLSGLQEQDIESVIRWLQEHAIAVLNVAGPRESSEPGIHAEARQWLLSLFVNIRQ